MVRQASSNIHRISIFTRAASTWFSPSKDKACREPSYNRQMQMKIIALCIFLGGIITGTAVFAETLGWDNDPGWGRGRIIYFIFGILICFFPVLYTLHNKTRISAIRNAQPPVSLEWIRQILRRPSRFILRYWFTLPVFMFVILVYVWFASAGSWTHWDSPTRYYAELAIGFENGTLHLPYKPNPILLQLSNPYDPLIRGDVDYLIDATLYKEKYFLYWGPAPALLLVAINPFVQGKVGDLYLVFTFLSGIFLIQYVLIIFLQDRFFDDLPKWMMMLSILVSGLCIPSTFILINEPNGRIYEAAITGGQFFLMLGTMFTLYASAKSGPSGLQLAFIGFCGVLAIGSRLILILPVAFLTCWLGYRILKNFDTSFLSSAMKLIPLGLPLILGVTFLGWYNWARFGSVTETGYSYQLAGVNIQKYRNDLFSPVYTVQNLYNYLLHPPAIEQGFPFLHATRGIEQELLPLYSLPAVYETNPITGLLFASPFTIFAIVPVIAGCMKPKLNIQQSPISAKNDSLNSLNWIFASLVGIFLSALVMLVVFFWAAMRYMVDFIPAITLISIIGFWRGYQLLAPKPTLRRFYSLAGIVSGGATIVMGNLLSLSLMYLHH
jgi:hypothetical protein